MKWAGQQVALPYTHDIISQPRIGRISLIWLKKNLRREASRVRDQEEGHRKWYS